MDPRSRRGRQVRSPRRRAHRSSSSSVGLAGRPRRRGTPRRQQLGVRRGAARPAPRRVPHHLTDGPPRAPRRPRRRALIGTAPACSARVADLPVPLVQQAVPGGAVRRAELRIAALERRAPPAHQRTQVVGDHARTATATIAAQIAPPTTTRRQRGPRPRSRRPTRCASSAPTSRRIGGRTATLTDETGARSRSDGRPRSGDQALEARR